MKTDFERNKRTAIAAIVLCFAVISLTVIAANIISQQKAMPNTFAATLKVSALDNMNSTINGENIVIYILNSTGATAIYNSSSNVNVANINLNLPINPLNNSHAPDNLLVVTTKGDLAGSTGFSIYPDSGVVNVTVPMNVYSPSVNSS